MTENLLQHIWQYKLYRPSNLISSIGEPIEVIHPGHPNNNSGPDFFNAKIKIDSTLWAGNVEIHINASDWNKHQHHVNNNYNNVILHVVLNNDKPITNNLGRTIPAIELSVNKNLLDDYKSLMATKSWLSCKDNIRTISNIDISHWLERLLILKLEDKYLHITQLLEEYNNNWNHVFFIFLSRAMGFGVNSDSFEYMAKSIPINDILHHSDNLLQLESFLFGQAGLLDKNHESSYYKSLKNEYTFLKHKYKLKNPTSPPCMFLRLRPSNFPTIRLSQLAYFIKQSNGNFEEFINHLNPKTIFSQLTMKASDFWDAHYTFEKTSQNNAQKTLGLQSKRLLIINAIVPLMFSYAKHHNNQVLQNRAIELLENLPPEKNSIVNKWNEYANKKVNSSFESQSVIYLNQRYCNLKKCLNCAIGHKVLNKSVN